jgi:hypothetical protein
MNPDTQGTVNKINFLKNIQSQPLTVQIIYRIKN